MLLPCFHVDIDFISVMVRNIVQHLRHVDFIDCAFAWFFLEKNQTEILWTFLSAMSLIGLFFLIWFVFILKQPQKYASYSWAMGMNAISSLSLNAFFLYYFLENTQILQVFGY